MFKPFKFRGNHVKLFKLKDFLLNSSKNFSINKKLNVVQPISMAFNQYASTGAESGAPPVVIMHGLLGSKNNWRGISKGLLNKFNPNRKVYAVDARNHGESAHTTVHSYEALSADIYQFFQDENIEKGVVIGHSMGGRAMMHFALEYPNLVDRAIILDISPIDVPKDFMYMRNIFQGMITMDVPKGTALSKARSIADAHLKKMTKDDSSFDFILQNLKRLEDGTITWAPNVKVLLNNLLKIGTFPQEILKSNQYRGPTLFIGGTQSNYIKQSSWPEIQKTFTNSQLIWFENSGHLVHFDEPERFIDEVTKFINKKF